MQQSDRALLDRPSLDALLSQAQQCAEEGRFSEAKPLYDRLCQQLTDAADPWCERGIVLAQLGLLDDAAFALRHVIAIEPSHAEAYYNLGLVCQAAGEVASAAAGFRQALRLKPDFVEALNNLGFLVHAEGDYSAARELLQRALQLRPDYAEAHYNLGVVCRDHGAPQQALEHYKKVLALQPEHVGAHWNGALVRLALGDLAAGWPEYEWGLRSGDRLPRIFPFPRWDGTPLVGQRIFVFAEQGVGDEVMFAACLPDLAVEAGHCIVECDPRLAVLFQRSFPTLQIEGRVRSDSAQWSAELGAVDVQIPAGSLPRFFRQSLAFFPHREHYLQADEARTQHWRAQFAALGEGLTVGISWRGGRGKFEQQRSIELARWQPLFAVRGVHFVNVQYGGSAAERERLQQEQGVTVHHWPAVDPLQDLDEFAAQISALDQVISVDNSTAHLAGALGVPVWVMLPFVADWRWMLEREDSPWYPSMHLFRQREQGSWDEPLQRVALALGEKNGL